MDFDPKITKIRTQGPSSLKKTKKAGSIAASFSSLASSETSESEGFSGISPSSSLSILQGLDALQGVAYEDSAEYVKKGTKILDGLELLRQEILLGEISVHRLLEIEDLVGQHKAKAVDPQLVSVLDEIDLRAKVELAKYQR